jgi:hypothetical protein
VGEPGRLAVVGFGPIGFTIKEYRPVTIEERTVTIPRKENTTKNEEPVQVWPLVEAALDKIEADPSTREAARAAMEVSDGCATLANFLNSQAKRVHEMDYRFKVPLVVMAAEMAREDGGAESIYDPEEGAIYFETEDHQFSFHVYKDWTVDWESVADRIEEDYDWDGVEKQVWALDWLMAYMEVPMDDYMVSDDEEEEEDEEEGGQHYSRI